VSRLVKNVLVVFTLLCIIFLAIFCIELIIVNWGSDSKEQSPQIAVVSPDRKGEKTDEPDTPDANPDRNQHNDDVPESPGNTGDNGDDTEQAGNNQGSKNKQYLLPMLDDVHTLELFADEELFKYSEGESQWGFTYTGGGKAELEVASDYISPPGGISELSKIFLTNYLDGGESTVGGEKQIGGSALRGVFVYGDKNGETYEAWIYGPLNGGETGPAVVFIVNYENEVQKTAIYAILDTLEMYTDATLTGEILAGGE
jgi:hypothetical protein